MPFEDRDNFIDDWLPMSLAKKTRRRDIVTKSLSRFIASFNARSRAQKSNTAYIFEYTRDQCAERAGKIVWYYEPFRTTLRDVVVHGDGNPKIDRHKIIAGKQASIMMTLPLRIKKYAHISEEEMDAWKAGCNQRELINPKALPDTVAPFVETILYNALFAFSLSVDILCIWNNLEQNASGFIDSNRTLCSCYTRLLLNTFRDPSGNPLHDSTFFWCSHLWFALEKNLLYWSKYEAI